MNIENAITKSVSGALLIKIIKQWQVTSHNPNLLDNTILCLFTGVDLFSICCTILVFQIIKSIAIWMTVNILSPWFSKIIKMKHKIRKVDKISLLHSKDDNVTKSSMILIWAQKFKETVYFCSMIAPCWYVLKFWKIKLENSSFTNLIFCL